jgi:hypothetical protein
MELAFGRLAGREQVWDAYSLDDGWTLGTPRLDLHLPSPKSHSAVPA